MDQLVIDAVPGNLDAVLNFVAKNLEGVKCHGNQRAQISIIAEEIFINISQYAYNPGVGAVVIRAAAGDGCVTLEFEDCGRPYNPLDKENPDIHASLDNREVGGLGVFMVKNMADALEYRREGNKNILTVHKNLA